MSDIFDKLNLIFDGPDHVGSIQHAKNMRDALSYLVAQTHVEETFGTYDQVFLCLLYTSPSPRDGLLSRMPSSA